MAGLALAAVLLAFGRYAGYYRFFYSTVPGFSLFRGPARTLMLFAFASAAASAILSSEIARDPKRYAVILSRAWKTLAGTAALILLVLLLSDETEGGRSLFWRIVVEKSLALGDRVSVPSGAGSKGFFLATFAMARTSLATALAWVAGSAAFFAALYFRPGKAGWAVPLILMVFVPADLILACGRYVKGSERFESRLENEVVDLLEPGRRAVPPRIATSRETEDLSRGSLSGISHVGGWEAAQLRRYCEFTNVLAGRPPEEEVVISSPIRPGRLLRLMGITHVLTSQDKPAYPGGTRILREDFGNLYEIEEAFPRAFLVHRVHVVPDKKKRLARIKTIDPLREAVVERRMSREPRPMPDGAVERITITDYASHSVVLRAEAASPAVLILTDSYYPAWSATIDGTQTAVFPANHMFRGVEVPAGTHEIVFSYDRSAYVAGRTISLVSLCAVVLFLLSGLMPGKMEKHETGGEEQPCAG